MKKLNDDELKQINGGGFHIGLGILIGAGVSFIIGLVDGYIRPLACR
jgi:lactobin A/cerein 7B family class IIb bacteriocin